jgi:hypothetical protein
VAVLAYALPTTMYITVYTTLYNYVTRFVVTRYRLVTELATRLVVSYYDGDKLFTVIAHPTRFIRAVNTVLLGVETRIQQPAGVEQPARRGGLGGTTIPVVRETGTEIPTLV